MSLHFNSVFIFSYSFLSFEGLIAYSLLIYKFYLDDRRHTNAYEKNDFLCTLNEGFDKVFVDCRYLFSLVFFFCFDVHSKNRFCP